MAQYLIIIHCCYTTPFSSLCYFLISFSSTFSFFAFSRDLPFDAESKDLRAALRTYGNIKMAVVVKGEEMTISMFYTLFPLVQCVLYFLYFLSVLD